MSEIFGVPMSGIMVVLVVLLVLCLLSVAWVALRRPVIFKLGVRNIPRRKAQTILIVVGLMLSTLIIAAALGTGDTIDYSATLAAYNTLGHADELVVYSRDEDGEGNINNAINDRIPQSIAQEVEAAFEGTDLIDGVMPVLIESVPAVLIEGAAPQGEVNLLALAQQGKLLQAEPATYLVGIDPSRLADFGGLKGTDGKEIALGEIAPDAVVISDEMSDKLGAKVGDTIGFSYSNTPYFLTVAGIAEDSPLSGRFDTNTPGMVIPLDRLQATTGQEGQLTTVAVSNRGGVRDGMNLTDPVVEKLKATFEGQPIGVDPIKKTSIELSKDFASIFTTFFLVFGLFSIAVGILLIVQIFTMLAAERRPEMGMARAIGAQRRQLIQQFISEGTGYAVFAGLVGAALGVGAAVSIALALKPLFGEFITIEPHVTPRSMIVAYCLGVVITFIAVVGSSWKISRLNIVAAVRDIPDVSSPTRKLRTMIWGVILILIGAILTFIGVGSNNAFSFYFGMSLLPFGIALILRYFGVPGRPVFSVAGFYIVVLWLLPDNVSTRLFGELNGDIEMFFLSGIFMVTGATIVIVQNLDWLLGGVSALGGLFRSKLPAVRTAVAFPGAAKGRTGMTIAMFSLIVFSLVMFATINENFVNLLLGDEANAGWDVRADQGQANPIGDTAAFVSLLNQRGVDTSDFQATGLATSNFQINLRQPGETNWRQYIAALGADAGFLTNSKVLFQQRATGYADDAAVMVALRTEPNVAVIDSFALASMGGFGSDPEQFRFDDPDGDGPMQALESGDETFDPRPLEIQAEDGSVATVNIIGIIDSKVSTLVGLYARQNLITPMFPRPAFTSYFVRLADPDQSDQKAKAIEQALLINGVQGTSIKDELKDAQSQNQAFLYIIQGFMGLGLIVGVAAVGVIAFRSVVERRQQIGVLRAIGYQSSLVSLSFLIETAFVVGLGVISGTVLGLILARNLFTSDDFAPSGADFVVPWSIVVAILVITIVAALLMTLLPARQASRLAPAEALRYE
ncbi:MAG: putative transport system permease protein [Thermomicrobiales bacterium]|nr:putative transport system permease protein [Thermomicrobiales bacterium]